MRLGRKTKINLKNKMTKGVFCHKSKQKRDYMMNYIKNLRKYCLIFYGNLRQPLVNLDL